MNLLQEAFHVTAITVFRVLMALGVVGVIVRVKNLRRDHSYDAGAEDGMPWPEGMFAADHDGRTQ